LPSLLRDRGLFGSTTQSPGCGGALLEADEVGRRVVGELVVAGIVTGTVGEAGVAEVAVGETDVIDVIDVIAADPELEVLSDGGTPPTVGAEGSPAPPFDASFTAAKAPPPRPSAAMTATAATAPRRDRPRVPGSSFVCSADVRA
jgi:hypothetical protein